MGDLPPAVQLISNKRSNILFALRLGEVQSFALNASMIYDSEKLLLLAGPCSLESLDTCRPVADALAALQQQHPQLNILFKGSFDKANRTSISSDRGTGLDAGSKSSKLSKQNTDSKPSPTFTHPSNAPPSVPSSMRCKSPRSCAARPTYSSPPPKPIARSTSKKANSSRPTK